MAKKSEFEIRLQVIDHMAKMLLEMADLDFENLSAEEEQDILQDFAEIAGHLLDSMTFTPSDSEDGVNFSANFTFIDPETYIRDFLKNIGEI
jgi:hypothetical protein